MRTAVSLAASAFAAGGAAVVGAAIQAERYVLRERTLPMPGVLLPAAGIRILHLSDMHLAPHNRRRAQYIASLERLKPDLVVLTGDFIASDRALELLHEALSPLRGVPGVFVYGSNDYFKPVLKNPLLYLVRNSNEGKSTRRAAPQRLNTGELTAMLESFGWVNLNNRSAHIRVAGTPVRFVGVNDPHVHYDRFPHGELSYSSAAHSRRDSDDASVGEAQAQAQAQAQGEDQRGEDTNATLTIGVTHSPYSRILDEMTAAGCSLVFAGHTHGGQVCLPGAKALVTNCDMDTAHVAGLFEWPVSAGWRGSHKAPVFRRNAEFSELAQAAGFATLPLLHTERQGDSPRTSLPSARQSSTHNASSRAAHTHTAWVQISAGLGTSPYVPLRTFCPPEAILLHIL
ncbi:MAG: metallophosphoesterase [Actinomycetaceae bacterium]|nr:metallophosphoesterase [Arcanobacterium sp.]MDD7505654.1 metallophosphoesterase [Actinomycetaceae bacterium]MDY6143438.1 metallophosphoesterase [Arcanobacterium sp.]